MSTRSARLTRANSAKQTVRSSRGFGSRPDRTSRAEQVQVDRGASRAWANVCRVFQIWKRFTEQIYHNLDDSVCQRSLKKDEKKSFQTCWLTSPNIYVSTMCTAHGKVSHKLKSGRKLHRLPIGKSVPFAWNHWMIAVSAILVATWIC